MHFHCFFKTDVLQKDFVTPVKVRLKRSLGLSVCAEFLREEVVVVLTAQFITLFNQTALEVRAAAAEFISQSLQAFLSVPHTELNAQ